MEVKVSELLASVSRMTGELSAKDAEIERLKAENATSSKLIDTLCEQARLAVEKEMLLNAQLAASEAKRKVLARECLAWRSACGCEPDRGEHWKALHVEGHMGWWWRPLPEADATDAAKALEAP